MGKFFRYLLTPFYVIFEIVVLCFCGIAYLFKFLEEQFYDFYWHLDD